MTVENLDETEQLVGFKHSSSS